MIKRAGSLFVTAYLLLIFCVYPFYMKDGYVDIGEGKYEFFLYCSLGVLLILAVLMLLFFVQITGKHLRNKQMLFMDWEKVSLSFTDVFVCLYLAVVSSSAVFSDFRQEAIWGVKGWHIGLVLWAVLCGLYFFISRLWQKEGRVWIVAAVASAVVFLLGILDSFSFYLIPLSIREAGFISTLGNINWFCGYLSVVAPVGICFWLFRECPSDNKKLKYVNLQAVCFGIYTVLAFMAGLCQGSNSVFLWFGGLFFVLLWIAVSKEKWLRDWFLLVFLWGLSAQLIRLMRMIFPKKYNYDLNNLCGFFTETNISLWIAGIALLCYWGMVWRKCALVRKGNNWEDTRDFDALQQPVTEGKNVNKIRKVLLAVPVTAVLLWVTLSAVNTWTSLSGFLDAGIFLWNESWGNGRGAAIKAAVSMFREMSLAQKLIGVGPDCFANYAYSMEEVAMDLRQYFGTSRLTNAHCEIATSLVNLGILGTLCYLGIFLSFIVRCFKRGEKEALFYMPAVCIICYLCHNLVSFAQVLNLPFVILIMAMGEGMLRTERRD